MPAPTIRSWPPEPLAWLLCGAVVLAGCAAAESSLVTDARLDARDAQALDAVTVDTASFDAASFDAMPCVTSGFVLDGALDASANVIAGGVTALRLAVAVSADGRLYIATDDAGEGGDHFILISATPPTAVARPAPFAKAGTVAAGTGDLITLADENDNGFSGWFRLEPTGGDAALSGAAYNNATGSNGGVVEGTVDLRAAFGTIPATLYFAAVAYASADGGVLVSAAQTPVGNGDGNVSADEYVTFNVACR
ncbi:MAG: hypothetical protein KBG15_05180 [Kofleriaceae bacterium]|nr:hypothetical protein [Kofleriaceae bacterium]